MKRSELLDAVVNARIKHIHKTNMTCESYLRDVLRYGSPTEPLVDMSDEQLTAILHELKLTVEDIR